MGLNLSKTAVIDSDTPLQLKKAFDLIDEIDEYLHEEMGVEEYPKPRVRPDDLSEGIADRAESLTNDELAVLHAQYVAWASFLNGRLAVIKAAHKLAVANLRKMKAQLSVELYAKDSIAKTEVADHILIHPLYNEFEVEETRLYMMKQILDARYDGYKRSADAISRLITLRQDEIEQAKQNPQSRGRRKYSRLKNKGKGRL
jgi:hypothetical protein